MLRKKREQSGITPLPAIRTRSVRSFLFIIVAIFLFLFAEISSADIPEPGIILYGKVFDNGVLMTNGNLIWTFTPNSGGTPLVLTTQLDEIEAEGGPYSYRIQVPLASDLQGTSGTDDALLISEAAEEYSRNVQVNGTDISRTDTVYISMIDRGTFENVNVGIPSSADLDSDGMTDSWEQAIVDADPMDGLDSVDDVLWNGDADGDGENNWSEFSNGTDPANAADSSENAYDAYHFEIYRGAYQTEILPPETSFWGAWLVCRPPAEKTFIAGNLIKPETTTGNLPVVELEIAPDGSEAYMQESDYGALAALADDYVSGEYKVILEVSDAGTSSSLWLKITVPDYTETDFPAYLTVTSPAVGEYGVDIDPLLAFSSDTWNYLQIARAEDGTIAYQYFNDENDDPADTHQIPQETALEEGTSYLLGLDTNGWGDTWLGSMTMSSFTTFFTCVADMDMDGDVDGDDIVAFEAAYSSSSSDADIDDDGFVDENDLTAFAGDYGKLGCR